MGFTIPTSKLYTSKPSGDTTPKEYRWTKWNDIQHFAEEHGTIFSLGVLITICALFGFIGYKIDDTIQSYRLGKIPLVFSEISQTKRLYAYQKAEVPATTLYYGVINDIAMKVFEANNISRRRGFSDRSFAQELEFKMDISFKEHHLISEYANEFPFIAQNALAALANIDNSIDDITPAVRNLSRIWDEDHDDVYHTEIYYVTVTDGEGKSHTEMRTRQVYDYTIHTYIFHGDKGQAARQDLETFFAKHENVIVDQLRPIIKETGAENEDAISRTIEKKNGKMISSDEAKAIVQENYMHSTLSQNISAMNNLHSYSKNGMPRFTSALTSSKNAKYQTYSHSDPGPSEYRVATDMYAHCDQLRSVMEEVITPIKRSNNLVQDLTMRIRDYINVSLDNKPGDKEELRNTIMETAKTLYTENFKAGIKVDTYSTGEMVLVIVLAIMLGIGASMLFLYTLFPRVEMFEDW